MNHIYKVVFCKSTNTFVAVAEYARSHGKGSTGTVGSSSGSSKFAKALALSALSAAVMLVNGTATAATVVTGATAGTGAGINITTGVGAAQTNASSQIAIGNYADARSGGKSIAIGSINSGDPREGATTASADFSIAIGSGAQAVKLTVTGNDANISPPGATTGNRNISIGNDSYTAGYGDIAVGSEAKVNIRQTDAANNRLQVEIKEGTWILGSTVIGNKATASSGGGNVIIGAGAKNDFGQSIFHPTHGTLRINVGQSTALGSRAYVYGDQSTAVGADTSAIGHSSIAIGGDDINQAKAKLQADIPEIANRSIDVGNLETVLPTLQARTGNDAVPLVVQSLIRSDEAITRSETQMHTVAVNASAGSNNPRTASVGNASIAMGSGSQTAGTGAMAIGVNAIAFDTASISQGVFSRARDTNTIAIGSISEADGDSANAIGHNARALAQDTNVMGHDAMARTRDGIAIGTDSISGAQKPPVGVTANRDTIHSAINGLTNVVDRRPVLAKLREVVNALNDTQKAELKQYGLDTAALITWAESAEANRLTPPNYRQQMLNRIVALQDILGGNQATAIGKDSTAFSTNSIAIGTTAQTVGAITGASDIEWELKNGNLAKTSTKKDGRPADATTLDAELQSATGSSQIAIGQGAVTQAKNRQSGQHSIAIGTGATTNYSFDIAIGAGSKVEMPTNTAGTALFTPKLRNNDQDRPSIAIGTLAHAGGQHGDVVIGAGATSAINTQYATGQATAIGSRAYVYGDQSLAIGADTRAIGNSSIAIGGDDLDKVITELAGVDDAIKTTKDLANIRDFVTNAEAKVLLNTPLADGRMYPNTASVGGASVAIGPASQTLGIASIAQGANALSYGKGSIAVGLLARSGDSAKPADAEDTIAIGTHATATGNESIAIGRQNTASGTQSIAIGVGNQVSGNHSGAFGDPSIVRGTESYTFGNDNAVSSTSKGVFVLGNNNQMGATPVYQAADSKKLNPNEALKDEVSVSGSVAIGNENKVTTADTFILGSGINVDDDGKTAQGGTVANSVYLGKDSTATSGSGSVTATTGAGTLNNLQADGTAGATTSGGATGVVNSAVVNTVTYNGFAGTTANGVVTVGSVGGERRIQNVAAGEISNTSTDAINGSQLYSVIWNSGWKLQGDGADKDFVRSGDIVNFIDGKGTNAVVTTATDGKSSTVTYDANYSNLTLKSGSDTISPTNNGDGTYSFTLPQATVAATPQNYFHVNPQTNPSTAGNDTNLANVDGIGGAKGGESLAAGVNAQATGRASVAVGKGASVDNTGGIAIGENASANVGTNMANTGTTPSTTPASKAIAIGGQATASHDKTVAVGDQAKATGDHAFAMGSQAEATAQYATAVGSNAVGTGQFATAVGKSAAASGSHSSAIGVDAKSTGTNSSALGRESSANGSGGVAIGYKAEAGVTGTGARDNAIAIGTSANSVGGHASIALGNTTKANSNNAIAIGTEADVKATSASGIAIGQKSNVASNNAIALGVEATVDAGFERAVALGSSSTVSVAVDTNQATVGNMTYSGFAGSTPDNGDVVSVGNGTRKRQIQNVAAGQITSTSTDAINGSQLYAVIKDSHWKLNANDAKVDDVNFGDTVNFKSSNNSVTITPTTAGGVSTLDLKVATTDLTTNDGKVTNPTTNGGNTVTAQNIAETINASGFNVANNEGAKVQQINPGETVQFVNGEGTTSTVTANGSDVKVTFNVNKADAPVVTPAGSTNAGKLGDVTNGGNTFLTAKDTIDAINNSGFNVTSGTTGTGEQIGGITTDLVKAGDTVKYIAGDNLSVKQEGTNFTFATKKDVKFDKVTVGDNKPVTINEDGIDMGDQFITNVAPNLVDSSTATSTPAGNLPANLTNNTKNAATVGDVLNAGWNLQGNSTPVDVVRHNDTVNFVDGKGTNVVVETTDKVTSTVKVNADYSNLTVTAGGDKVNIVDNGDGTFKFDVPAGEKPSVTDLTVNNAGNVDVPTDPADKTKFVTAEEIANTINETSFTLTKAAAADGDNKINAGDKLIVKDGVGTTATVDGNSLTFNVNKATLPTAPTNGKYDPANITNAGDTFLTAKDTIDAINNSGFNVTSGTVDGGAQVGGAPATELVNAGETVKYIAGKNLSVKQEGAEFTFATKNEVEFDKVTVGNSTNPITINNNTIDGLNSNLPDTFNANNPLNPDNKPVTKAQTLPDTITTATLNNAATVGDVLNAGFNVKNNGADRDFVKPYDTVNFVNGTGTTAVVETDTDGKVSNVTYNVNVDNKTTKVTYLTNQGETVYEVKDPATGNVTYNTKEDGTGTTVAPTNIAKSQITAIAQPVVAGTTVKGGDNITVEQNGDEVTVNVDMTPLTTTDGKVNTPAEPTKIATAGDIAKAVNETGFNLKTSATADGQKVNGSLTADSELINPADTVEMVAGKNLTVQQDQNGKVTFATKDDVTFNSVFTNTLTVPTDLANPTNSPITITKDGITAGNKPITNVAGNFNGAAPNTTAPTTVSTGTPTAVNNAATVGDVLNAGWNLQNNGVARDFVRHADIVNFVNGKGTTANVITNANGTASTVQYDANYENLTINVGGTNYKVTGDANTGYTFTLPNTGGNNTGTSTGGIAGGDTLDTAKPVTSSTIINGQGTKVHVDTQTDPNDPSKSTTVLKVDSPIGYVNTDNAGNVTNDTSNPTNVVTMIGKDDKKPVNVTNVASGSNLDIPKKEEGDTLTPNETKDIINAISNASGDQLNNAVNVGDLKALLGDPASIKTYDAASNIERLTINYGEAISNMNKEGIRFFHTNSEEKADGTTTGRNPVDSSAKGEHATAIGYQAQAVGNQSVSFGNSIFVEGEKFTDTNVNVANIDITETQANANSAYLTTYTDTEKGKSFTVQTTMARGDQSVAMGNGSQALGDKSIAIGVGNVVTGKGSGAIGDPNNVHGDGAYVYGNNNTVTVEGKNSFVFGSNVNMNIANSVALGHDSTVTATDVASTAGTGEVKTATVVGNNVTMTYGEFAGAKADGVVSVGAEGNERRIQNVAAGKISEDSTDAINGSQLHAVAKGLQDAINNVDLTPINNRINEVEGDANAGVSSAMAMAALPQAYLPGKSMLTGGMATYNGEGAVAVGLSKLSDNGRWVFKASGSADTQGNVGAAVGAGFHF